MSYWRKAGVYIQPMWSYLRADPRHVF
jgi:hypothetical protein